MKIFNLEATFKRNRLGYWNSCKRLPNFVNVAALANVGYLFLRQRYVKKILSMEPATENMMT